MPVVRMTGGASLVCALLLVGCRSTLGDCPKATADFEEIPSGLSHTDVTVEVSKPMSPDIGIEVTTELTAVGGSFADPFARETVFTCDHDVSGEVEICVNATYKGGRDDNSPDESDASEEGASLAARNEDPNVGASYQYIRPPHVRIPDPVECSEMWCATILCPEEKNVCPVVSSLTVEPSVVPEGGTATIDVVAEDPDDNPEPLVTTLSARNGTIADPNARQTTYTCDPAVGGAIEICVQASDGDPACDVKLCTSVRCPGDPLDNTCPIIEIFTADPNPIPSGQETTAVVVGATDPDDSPEPLRTKFTSATGAFEDPLASQTIFRCGEPGLVDIFVSASDGDPDCDQTRSISIQCPSDVRPNLCPQLFIINAIPRTVPLGETKTRVETRGQDTDGVPLPLKLTLNSLWGSFENTENIQEPKNVVVQNALYVCDRPGEVEICVDATDGACVKTLCDLMFCPPDIPVP